MISVAKRRCCLYKYSTDLIQSLWPCIFERSSDSLIGMVNSTLYFSCKSRELLIFIGGTLHHFLHPEKFPAIVQQTILFQIGVFKWWINFSALTLVLSSSFVLSFFCPPQFCTQVCRCCQRWCHWWQAFPFILSSIACSWFSWTASSFAHWKWYLEIWADFSLQMKHVVEP